MIVTAESFFGSKIDAEVAQITLFIRYIKKYIFLLMCELEMYLIIINNKIISLALI